MIGWYVTWGQFRARQSLNDTMSITLSINMVGSNQFKTARQLTRPTFWTQNQDINIECLDVRVHMTHDTWASIWLVSTVSDKSRLMQVIHLRSIMLARIRVIIITWWMICLPQLNVGESLRGQGPLLRNFRFVVMCCCVFDCTGIKLVLENLNASIIASKN